MKDVHCTFTTVDSCYRMLMEFPILIRLVENDKEGRSVYLEVLI
jgi:hypothetical protein